MENPFKSRLFIRSFVTTTTLIVALFIVMFSLSVPFIQSTVENIEEKNAQTVLNHIYDGVEKLHRDIDLARTNIVLARKKGLSDVLSVVESRAAWLEQQVSARKLDRDRAKRMLLDEIRQIHYGNNDYVWASNYASALISHPDPALNGVDFSTKRDMRGNLIVPPMVAIARAQGDGYYSYWWRRLGQEHQIEKLSYFKHIPFFELVIGTGIYIDDIDVMIERRRTVAIDELRAQLRNTALAKTGYVYIFDSKFDMLIHPNANIEGKNFAGVIDPISRRELPPMLVAAADKPGGVRYKWDSPSDPGHYAYEKISWVRYSPDFDWYICSSIYMDELGASARTLLYRLLVVFVIALLLAVTGVYFFVKRITAPLKSLSDTALQVTEGDFTARCKLQRDDEIGVVATAFNGMIDRLQDNLRHLDTRVWERTAALEKANQELKQLDRLKSGFLSAVSHELRTPVTSIVGFIKLIKRKLNDTIFPKVVGDEKTVRAMAQVRENLDVIVNESGRLTLLINDVLDSAKLEAGENEWDFASLIPAQLVDRAITLAAGLAKQKGLSLTYEIAPELPFIVGDENRLLQVLMNLIANAVKFTVQGRVALGAVRQEAFVRFCVQDTGIGIAPEDQEQVFEKFRQIGDTLTDKPQGTGLGLSICRQIVEAHGGEIWMESQPGQGSAFYFTVPLVGD